jgi:trigger factor
MKTEFIDVSETQKNLVVEIPSTVVDAEIDKVARDYSKAARVPGFRPGKVPAKVVRQRFRDQILHDVATGSFRGRWTKRFASAASSRSTPPTSVMWSSKRDSR